VAPVRTPKSKRGLVNRLTAKVGPLPVWVWAAVILGAYLLYSRLGAQSTATTSPDAASASTPDGTTGAAQVPASGQGGAADNLSSSLLDSIGADTASIDALTSQILSMPTPYSNFGDGPAAGTPAGDLGYGVGPAAQPTVTQAAPAPGPTGAAIPANTGAGHLTQTAAGVLKWGGVNFTTKDQFNSWAAAHGTTATRELSNHPQARAIYSTLK
jgi:hypothetical protein